MPIHPSTGRAERHGGRDAFTLLELLIAVTAAGLLAALGAWGVRRYREAVVLEGAARVGRAALVRARMEAIYRGGRVRVRKERSRPPELVLRDGDERPIARFALGPRSGTGLDSAELRRSTLSFNGRGQAAPGSLYLYEGSRGIRLVVNFIGRIRRESFEVTGR